MIVSAVGAASGTLNPIRTDLSKRIEAAMTEAVKEAQAEGITDPDLIRSRMLEARSKVK